MAIHRTLEETPELTQGTKLYQVSGASGIPDDDGDYSFAFWVTAPDESEARAQAQAHLDKVGEGGVIHSIDEEITSLTPDMLVSFICAQVDPVKDPVRAGDDEAILTYELHTHDSTVYFRVNRTTKEIVGYGVKAR